MLKMIVWMVRMKRIVTQLPRVKNLPEANGITSNINSDVIYGFYYLGSRCQYNEFACTNSTQCIPKSMQCDFESDCLDGTDEIGCCKCSHYFWVELCIFNTKLCIWDKLT